MSLRSVHKVAGAGLLIVAAVSLAGCGITIPPLDSTPGPDPAAPLGWSELSTLDPDGVNRILASQQARFDMSEGEIQKGTVGLGDADYGPDVNADGELIDLEIIGPAGTLTARTDYIRFFTADDAPTISRITYFLAADEPEDFFQLLRDGSDAYGIDSGDVESWISSIQSDSDGVSRFSFQPGTLLGMNVNYDVRYDAASPPQVVIVEVYP